MLTNAEKQDIALQNDAKHMCLQKSLGGCNCIMVDYGIRNWVWNFGNWKFPLSYRILRHRLKMSWTLVHKRIKIGLSCLPTLRKFRSTSFPGFADRYQQTKLNQTLPTGGQ